MDFCYLTKWGNPYYFLKLMMRIGLFLLFITGAELHAENLYSQKAVTRSINLSFQNVSLKKVLDRIEKDTGYSFLFTDHSVDTGKKMDVNIHAESINEALDVLFQGIGVDYRIVDWQIILTKKKVEEQSVKQQKRLTGVVKDEKGEPVIGANVVEKGTTNGTTTDLNGKFTLNVPENVTLLISFIGYTSQEILVIKEKNNYEIILREDTQNLDEVVVVGYGSMKKSDLTGSVVSLKTDKINSPNNSNLVQMMQGHAAGVVVTQSSMQPGGASEIHIRGISSVNASKTPLYVIDGFPVDNTNFYPGSNDVFDGPKKDPLNGINPSDIEHIEVLKDASATAIYGSRAANGVILITTKKGKKGRPKITLNSSFGVQTVAKRFHFLDATEFAKMTNDMFAEFDKKPYYDNAESFGKGTDWFEEVTHKGIVTSHDLSMEGGSDNTKYMVSANYYLNNGIIKESSFERYSFRANLEQKISKIFSLSVSSFMSNTIDKNVAVGTRAEDTGILGGAYAFPSIVPVYDEDGNFSKNPRYIMMPNPVSLFDIDDKTRSKRSMLNASLNITPTDYLTIKLQGATDIQDSKREYYNPKTTIKGSGYNGLASVTTTQGRSDLFEGTITFDKEINHHKLNTMVGYTYQDFTYEDLSATVSNFFTDYFGYNNIGIGEECTTPTTSKKINKLLSGIARVNYNYDDRYLITATFRADGSSKFAKKNRFGYFPSFSIAWRISNEKFMKNMDYISNLKLRSGYGETGNQDIGDNSYLALLGKGYPYVFGDREVTTIIPTNAGNPILKWENAKQLNVALDMGFLNNRISATLEYYQINTTNLLLKFSTPAYSGFTSQWKNAGKIQNKGLEFTLNTINIKTPMFVWETSFTLSHNKNLWKDRAGLAKPYIGAGENDPVNAIYGYIYDGIWQEGEDITHSAQPNSVPGNIRFADIGGRDENGNFMSNPDGKIDDADITYLGTPDPKVEFGFGNDFTYRKWNLNIFFNARVGGKKYNQFRSYYENPIRVYEGVNAFSSVQDRWTPSNPSSTIHSGLTNPYGGDINTYYVENSSFLRLKSVRLTYNTKIEFIPMSVYLDAQNIFTVTDYSGYDPETGGTNDFNTYPPCHSFMLGLKLSF